MRVAVIGSRGLNVDISQYIPDGTSAIISGGARGIDTLAERWADAHGVPKLIIRPDYARYGNGVPLRRNELIVDAADMVVAVWDGTSRGTAYTVGYARKVGKRCVVWEV